MTLVAHGCPILINCADGEDAARHTEYIITPDETINKRYGNTTVKNQRLNRLVGLQPGAKSFMDLE